jgi:hypothetical protein
MVHAVAVAAHTNLANSPVVVENSIRVGGSISRDDEGTGDADERETPAMSEDHAHHGGR